MFRTMMPILLLITSGMLFFLYIDPTYQDAQTVKAEVVEYDDALEKSKELQKIRDDLLAKYNTFTSDDLKRLELLLPDTVDNVRLVLDIDTIAARYGMVIKDLKLTGATEASESFEPGGIEIESVQLQFAVSSDYQTFLSFMRDLQDSLRIIDINDIDFTAPEVAGKSASALASAPTLYKVTIRTYWLP